MIAYKAPTLHKGQVEIAKQILEKHAIFNTIVTSRQFGKSFLMIQLMLYYAFTKPGSSILCVSLTHAHTSKILHEIQEGLMGTGLIYRFRGDTRQLIFVNKSTITFRSTTYSRNIRGGTYEKIFCDEAAFYSERAFTEDISPTATSTKDPQFFLFSTPNGTNWFYKKYELGKEGVKDHLSVFGHWKDNPRANLAHIEAQKASLSESTYAQEYEGYFKTGSGSIFSNILSCATIESWPGLSDDTVYYAGIDIGGSTDSSVVTIINDEAEVVDIIRTVGIKGDALVEKIRIGLNKWNPKCTYVERNGIGYLMYDFISQTHKSVESWTTGNKNKGDIIDSLVWAFEKEKIRIPSENLYPMLHRELNDFGLLSTPNSNNRRFAALTGHDDHVMSLAFAYRAFEDNHVITSSSVYSGKTRKYF